MPFELRIHWSSPAPEPRRFRFLVILDDCPGFPRCCHRGNDWAKAQAELALLLQKNLPARLVDLQQVPSADLAETKPLPQPAA